MSSVCSANQILLLSIQCVIAIPMRPRFELGDEEGTIGIYLLKVALVWTNQQYTRQLDIVPDAPCPLPDPVEAVGWLLEVNVGFWAYCSRWVKFSLWILHHGHSSLRLFGSVLQFCWYSRFPIGSCLCTLFIWVIQSFGCRQNSPKLTSFQVWVIPFIFDLHVLLDDSC